MKPIEYALRNHEEPELSFHTVWLNDWSRNEAFYVMQALRWKDLYYLSLERLGSEWSDKDYWNKTAVFTHSKYEQALRTLENGIN